MSQNTKSDKGLGDTDNVGKTKELFIYFKNKGGEHTPIYINGIEFEEVESVKFVGVMITDNLSWISYIYVTVKKAQQHLFFLRQLRRFGTSIRTLTNFYRCTIESIQFKCLTVWYGKCSAQDHNKLQKGVCTAQTIIKANRPSMDSIYMAYCHGK
eukprot:g21529.t1